MSHRALLAAGLAVAALSAEAADLVALRVTEPATLLRAGKPLPLAAGKALQSGDVVSAGARGKVALQLGGSGSMTLSSLGDVQIFEAKAAAKPPALAKIKLLAGALRVDSRAGAGKPAQDIRLNVGSLKARLLDADAWGANTAEGDTLCLMAGVASVQTGATGGDERLDAAGSCLRREPDGQLSRFAADTDPVLTAAIAATRFDGGGEIVSTVLAEAAAEEAVVATPLAPVPAIMEAPPPKPVARPAAAAAVVMQGPQPSAPIPDVGGGWTVVVLSLGKPEPVAARAQYLAAQGLPAATRVAEVKGNTVHRVVIGSFATQAEARSYAATTLAASGIKGWPAPL